MHTLANAFDYNHSGILQASDARGDDSGQNNKR
jgi:hypothetical protein